MVGSDWLFSLLCTHWKVLFERKQSILLEGERGTGTCEARLQGMNGQPVLGESGQVGMHKNDELLAVRHFKCRTKVDEWLCKELHGQSEEVRHDGWSENKRMWKERYRLSCGLALSLCTSRPGPASALPPSSGWESIEVGEKTCWVSGT